MTQVYLIHFDRHYHHALHYVGFTNNQLKRRCKHHANGTGARLMQVVTQAGIGWHVVRTWQDADRDLERRIKRWHGSAKLCPICNPDHWQDNLKEDSKL